MRTSLSATSRTTELSGLLVIDKPAGMTSRDVVNRVQRVTGIRRCGHAGTLDPLATGVLVVCLGQATRLVETVQKLRKCYRADFRFGLVSNTDDIEGDLEPVAQPTFPSPAELTACLEQMTGEILQLPPRFSAKRVQGRRAYDLARQGIEPDLQPSPVQIYRNQLLAFQPPDWTVRIECGSGTYVRSIGRDVGAHFGCGAVMTALIRESIGDFSVYHALHLEDLNEDWPSRLIPPAAAVTGGPTVTCTPLEAEKLRLGQRIACTTPDENEPPHRTAVLDPAGQLVALACISPAGFWKPEIVFHPGPTAQSSPR